MVVWGRLRGDIVADGTITLRTDVDTSGVTKGIDGIKSAVSKAGKAFAALGAAGVAAVGAAVKVGMDFESSMSQVAATMGITTEEIAAGSKEYEKLAKAAKDAGATTKFTASEAAEALNYLALAGYDAATATEVLPSVLNLAAAGGMDLAYASDLATDAMAALGIEATNANLTHFGDQLAVTAQKSNTSVSQLGEAILTVGGLAKTAGMSTETLNTALGALANRGLKGAEGGTHLRNMINSLISPTSEAAKTLNDLNVTIDDGQGHIRDLGDIFADLKNSMKDLDQATQTRVLAQLFNTRDISAASGLLASMGEEWNTLKNNISSANGTMQDMADTMNDNLKGKITILKSALEGFGIAVYEKIEEPLKNATTSAIESVGGLTTALTQGNFKKALSSFDRLGQNIANSLSKGISVAIKTLPKVVAVLVPQIIKSGVTIGKALVDGIVSGLTGLSPVLTAISGAFISAFSVAKILPIVTQISNAIKATTVSLSAYQAAIAANANVSILLASTLKPLEVLFGVLTGKISLATAAQVAWNAVMNINPVVLITTALAALTGAIIGTEAAYNKYVEQHSAVVQATKDIANAAIEAKEKTEQLADSIQSLSDTAETSIQDAEAEAYANRQLADELYNLADKANKTSTEKQRMQEIVNSLNGSVEDLNLTLDWETGQLNLTRDAVDELIERKLELAKTNAIQDLYTENLKAQYKAEADAAKNAQSLKDAYAQLNDIIESGTDITTQYGGTHKKYTTEQVQSMENLRDAIAEYQDALGTSENAVKDSYASMQALSDVAGIKLPDGFETAQRESENFFKEIEIGAGIQKAVSNDIQNSMYGVATTAQEQGAKTGEAYTTAMEFGVTANGQKVAIASQQTIANANNQARATASSQSPSVGSNIVSGIISGVQSAASSLYNSLKNLASKALNAAKSALGIHSPSRLFKEQVGVMIVQGVIEGIRSTTKALAKALSAMAQEASQSEWLSKLELAENVDDLLELQKEYVNGMLDSQKHYYIEKRKAELEAEDREYKERLASAKDNEEIEKIKQDRINKYAEKKQQAYLDGLKDFAEREQRILEERNDYITDTINDTVDQLTDSIDDLQKAQDKMAERLRNIGSIWKDTELDLSTRFSGQVEATDLSVSSRRISADRAKWYKRMLDELKEQDFDYFSYVKSLNFDEGFEILKKIDRMNDKTFANFLKVWHEEQDTYREIEADLAEKTELADLSEHTEAMKQYVNTLEQVKSRGDLPEGFFSQLRDMDIDEGLKFANALLELSDEEFNKYLADWKEYQEVSKQQSKLLFIDEADELSRTITDKFNGIENEFFTLGEKSGVQFENSFIANLKETLTYARSLVAGAFENLTSIGSIGKAVNIPVPAMATGGIVPHATLAMIGERGREAVLPLEQNTQWMDTLAQKVANIVGGNNQPIILKLDGRELGRAVVNTGGATSRILGTKLVIE